MKNRIVPTVCGLLVTLTLCAGLRAQNEEVELRIGRPIQVQEQQILLNDVEVVMQPVLEARLPELSDLHQAKMHVDGEQMQLVEAYRSEKQERQVTTIKQETRTRQVVVDGETVEQEFTVNVPVTTVQPVDVKVPAGRKPTMIPATECRFYDMQGQEIAVEVVAKRLENLQPVFLLDGTEGSLPKIPAIIGQVIKDECLIVVTSRVIRENRRFMFQNAQGVALPAFRAIPAIPLAPPAAVPALRAAPAVPAKQP